uniref:Uncharacterized protein n=1 Tax=Candidatus Kentrum sp. DK TaxID=2126562 RepID=A0A450SGM3_9GAMM|nr:MAG: hypothetical protein BECKDK2373C_GA0170839_103514 [Candidatus Kentron sp. DK]
MGIVARKGKSWAHLLQTLRKFEAKMKVFNENLRKTGTDFPFL